MIASRSWRLKASSTSCRISTRLSSDIATSSVNHRSQVTLRFDRREGGSRLEPGRHSGRLAFWNAQALDVGGPRRARPKKVRGSPAFEALGGEARCPRQLAEHLLDGPRHPARAH